MAENNLSYDINIDDNLFEKDNIEKKDINAIVRPSLTYWQDAWIRFKRNKIAMVCLTVLIIYVALAIIGPYLTPYDFKTNNAAESDVFPNMKHWFGTDQLGRDLWARTWMGARVSLFIGFLVATLNCILGIFVGGVSGYFGGKVDMVIMRIIDVLYGIPMLIVAILVMVVLGSGVPSLVIAMITIGWIGPARFVRGQILQMKNQEFIQAAKVLGASSMRIIWMHLIPNMLGLLITNLTMAVPNAIFTEAFLSYIGLGIKSPDSSWGQLAKQGAQVFRVYPFELLIPAFFICTTMLSLNLLGDGLRDALDPKRRSTSK